MSRHLLRGPELWAGRRRCAWGASAMSLCLWLALPGNAHTDESTLLACQRSNRILMTIGLTERHRDLGRIDHAANGTPGKVLALDRVCPAFAYGNDYQILDWLERGRIDAAIVSPFVAEMFHERGERPLSRFFAMAESWPFANASMPSYRTACR